MTLIWVGLSILLIVCFYLLRFHVSSVLIRLSSKLQKGTKGVEVLHSLRQNLVHERKKKIAGLEMILSSWEKGEEVQPRYGYYQELLGQLKDLVRNERRDLMAVTTDVFLWAKLWRLLLGIGKISREKMEKSDVVALRKELGRFRQLVDEVVEDATERFSFSLNDAVRESLKTVRIEKSNASDIKIEESLDDVGDSIRFSYSKFKEWQRLLTNLIRNAVEAVEAKAAGGAGVAEGFSLRGEEEPVAAGLSLRGGGDSRWVVVSTRESEKESSRAGVPDLSGSSVSVIIEDSGTGMDEATSSSFFKKGFTSGKEHGLGLGVTEECVEMIGKYGGWQIESKKGMGTRITISIDQDRARKGELILPEAKPFYRTRLAFGLYFFGLVLVGLALLFAFDKYLRFWVDWNPAVVKLLDEKTVVVENKGGVPLWDRGFPHEVEQASLTLGDLDNDGRTEVLIGTRSGFRETGYLFCFSYDGREMWRFALGAEAAFGALSDLYNTDMVLARDLDLDGEMEIVVAAGSKQHFPYQIALLNKHGKLESSYWHSGIIKIRLFDDIDGDSIPEIVFGGVNNRLRFSAVIGILDFRTIHGQSPPYEDDTLENAEERVYIKFPCVEGLGGENQLFSIGREFMYMGEKNGLDFYMVQVYDHGGFIRDYYLDENLESVRDIVINPDSRVIWQKLREDGILDYDLTAEVIENWKEIEVWKHGEKVR